MRSINVSLRLLKAVDFVIDVVVVVVVGGGGWGIYNHFHVQPNYSVEVVLWVCCVVVGVVSMCLEES